MTFEFVEYEEPRTIRSGPGRPRDESYDDRVLRAATRLIDTGKPVTIREIIKASGISRSAIYRRWPSMHELIAAALDRGRANGRYFFTGNVKSALTRILFRETQETIGSDYTDKHLRRHQELMMANPRLQKVYWDNYASRRVESLQAALRTAMENGEISADTNVEAAVDAILGAMLFQSVVRGEPLTSPEALERSQEAFEIIWRGLQ